jgi:hypothetical protein
MQESLDLNVVDNSTNDPDTIVKVTQNASGFKSLGKEIKISPKSHVMLVEKDYKLEYFTPTVSLIIGIGTDYNARLVMSQDAWKALKKDEEIHITSSKEFKAKYL